MVDRNSGHRGFFVGYLEVLKICMSMKRRLR